MMMTADSFLVRPDAELAERLRNAVAHIGGGLTPGGVLADVLRRAVEDLEREHNNGQPFPARPVAAPRVKPSGEPRAKKLAPPAVVRERQRRERDAGPPRGPRPPVGRRP